MLGYQNRKKLKKLLRDPKKFLMDSKKLRFIARLFKLSGGVNTAAKKVEVLEWNNSFELLEKQDATDFGKKSLLLFGFHDWKKPFLQKFIPEFRLIFAKPSVSLKDIDVLRSSFNVEAFVSWGVSDDPILEKAAERFKLPIWTMEDGFLRSVDLGSNHVEPRSLILDRSGIYFDARRPSDIEILLNSWNLDQGSELLKHAVHLIEVFKYLSLSKYNPPSLSLVRLADIPPFFDGKAVLVIGQLSKDASLRYGGCEEMSNEKLIEAALSDYPEARVIYRPHPDELKHNKKHLDDVAARGFSVEIADGKQSLADIFDKVSHVYTMTSLAGFEALLFGKKVTVFGAPFYAGWGLTDDRIEAPRRERKLSLLELFTIAYLVYPRYIGCNSDPVLGFLSAMQMVVAEREIAIHQLVREQAKIGDVALYRTVFWPALLLSNLQYKHDVKLKNQFGREIPFKSIFSPAKTTAHRRFLAYLIGGVAENSPQLSEILTGLRQNLSAEILADLLSDLWQVRPTTARLEHWAQFCEENDRSEEARLSFEYMAASKALPKGRGRLEAAESRSQFKLAQFEARNKNYGAAKRILESILLSGDITPDVLDLYGQIAISTFEYALAFEIYLIIKGINFEWKGAHAFLMCARLASLVGDRSQAFINAATACYLNPRQICSLPEDTGFTFDEVFEGLDFSGGMCNAVHAGEKGSVVGRAAADISIGNFSRAEQALNCYGPSYGERDLYLTFYSQSLSYQGKIKEAKSVIVNSIEKSGSFVLLREAFRLAVQANDYNWTRSLLGYANSSGLPITEIYKRKAATVLGDERLYYLCLREMGSSDHLKRHFGKKYVQSYRGISFKPADKSLILAYFGPGDEIRWAALYPEMANRARPAVASFTCDPRLHTLLKRSFPLLDFIPVKRTRNLRSLADVESIRELPGAELFRHIDNRGWAAVTEADYVSLQVDLLADVITDHSDLSGEAFLVPDPALVAEWEARLSEEGGGRKKVGISWRSSILSTTRNQYYLDIEHVESIIRSFPELDFYCLQYDDCADELAWLETRLPSRLRYFENVDYFNDFENVSALIKNLDFVVSPGTSIIELAGAIGVESVFFSTTAELDWRYRRGSDRDVWHSSVRHVKAEPLNDKAALVEVIKGCLKSFLLECGV